MASATSAYSDLGTFQHLIEACLKRCAAAPYPTAEREDRIRSIRNDLADISRRAGIAFEDMTKDAKADLAAKQAEIATAEARLATLHGDRRTVELNHSVEYADSQQRLSAATTEQDRKDIQAHQIKLGSDFTSRHGPLSAEISKLEPIIARLQHERNALGKRFDVVAEKIRAMDCPEALAKVVDDAKVLVDRAGRLEQEIASTAGAILIQEAQSSFDNDAKSFETAEAFHRSQARRLFWTMIAVGGGICVLIYGLFIARPPMAPAPTPGISQSVVVIEHVVLVATGRVALLVMFGFALKYLAALHRTHAEQSVIYRDRLAALGIAANLLKATPELNQRRELLKSLANVYLDFDESAFARHRRERAASEEREDVDHQIKRLKMMTEAVAPILEPVGRAIDKVRGTPK